MNATSIFNSLFYKHKNELVRYINNFSDNKEDTDDILQDTFYQIINNTNPNKLQNPRAFLFKVAKNLAINSIRYKKYRDDHMNTQCTENALTPTLETEIIAIQDAEIISTKIMSLPEKTKKVFLMNRLEYKTYDEIGVEIGISKNAVKKHVVKTLKVLRRS